MFKNMEIKNLNSFVGNDKDKLKSLKEYAEDEIKRYYELIKLENNSTNNCFVYRGQIKAYKKIIEHIECDDLFNKLKSGKEINYHDVIK